MRKILRSLWTYMERVVGRTREGTLSTRHALAAIATKTTLNAKWPNQK